MRSPTPTVFVCSATGSQGGAVVQLLRELNWNVHATVRNMDSSRAMDLKAAGVDLIQGDWDDSAALTASIAGCDKLFLCLLPSFADMSCELRQAQSILQIAKSAGVRQVVASTSLGVSQLDSLDATANPFMQKHLTSKTGIEHTVRDTGFESWTFLRPAFFMANFLEPKIHRYAEIRDTRTWKTSMTADTRLPLVDHVDIAKLAVDAFRGPERFHDQAIGVASDLLKVQDALDQLGEATGRPGSFQAIFMTDEEIAAKAGSKVPVNSQKNLMRSAVDHVDMAALAKMIRLTTFKRFREREKEAVEQTYR